MLHNLERVVHAPTSSLSGGQCSTEVVFAAEFNPHDDALLATCGKNNINFWKLEGKDLVRKQGIFEVKMVINFH